MTIFLNFYLHILEWNYLVTSTFTAMQRHPATEANSPVVAFAARLGSFLRIFSQTITPCVIRRNVDTVVITQKKSESSQRESNP